MVVNSSPLSRHPGPGSLSQATTVNYLRISLAGWYTHQRNQRSNCQRPLDHRRCKRVPEKHLLLLYWWHQSLWLCGSQQAVENSERWEYQTTWPASWETCIQFREQQLELDMEQQNGSQSGKEYVKAEYCHPAYLTYMQSTSWETLDWNQDCQEKYQ